MYDNTFVTLQNLGSLNDRLPFFRYTERKQESGVQSAR